MRALSQSRSGDGGRTARNGSVISAHCLAANPRAPHRVTSREGHARRRPLQRGAALSAACPERCSAAGSAAEPRFPDTLGGRRPASPRPFRPAPPLPAPVCPARRARQCGGQAREGPAARAGADRAYETGGSGGSPPRCGPGRGAERPRRGDGNGNGSGSGRRGPARAAPPPRLLPRRLRVLLLLRHPAGEHHARPVRGGPEAGEVPVRADARVHPVRGERGLRQAPDPCVRRCQSGSHPELALRRLLPLLPGCHGVQQLGPAVRQLPHAGPWQILQAHSSHAFRSDFAAEEVPPSQVLLRPPHRGRRRPLPVQAKEGGWERGAHLWLWRAPPAAVADPGRAHWGVSGPHESSLPDRFQPHDAEREPLVHLVPGGWDFVHWGALGVPELHGAISQRHLQHPALRPHQCPGSELHFHDRGVLRPSDVFHHHHNPQVLHHLSIRHPLCQPHQLHAVGGDGPRVLGPRTRCQVWEGSEEDVALRRGRSLPLEWTLIYCLVPQNRLCPGLRPGARRSLALPLGRVCDSELSSECNPSVLVVIELPLFWLCNESCAPRPPQQDAILALTGKTQPPGLY